MPIKKKIIDENRLPPQDLQLEKAVLGAMLESFPSVHKLCTFLPVDLFYSTKHRNVYKVILELFHNKEPVDILTVTSKSREMGLYNDIGGAYEITLLTSNTASTANTEYHARILYQLYLRRRIIALNDVYSKKSFDETFDIIEEIDNMQEELKKLTKFSNEKIIIKGKHIANEMIVEMEAINRDPSLVTSANYNIGDAKFDELVGLSPDKILLVSGASGHGKSKYVRSIIFKLFKGYADKIAVDWVSLEDSAKDIVRAYISKELFIKTKDIKNRKYDKGLEQTMLSLYDEFSHFDIEFTEVRTYIKSICNHFRIFCENRPDKFNILVVDNILSMEDLSNYKDQVGFADHVMGEILKCRQETHGLIIPIHHYKDAQQDKTKVIDAYRPMITDLKGSEAYRRVPNQVLLLNNVGLYKDVMSEYSEEQQRVIERIFLVDTGKNREDSNIGDTIIRYLFSLDYDVFEEL